MMDFICFSLNNWEERKARKQQFMLALSLREDVSKVLYVEPPLNFFRLLLLPFLELRTLANRKRWLRALKFRIENLADSQKLFIFTPVFFIPFSFRVQSIYNLNCYFSYLIVKLKIRKLDFKNIVLWLYHPFDYCLLRWFKEKKVSCFDWAEDWAAYFEEFHSKKRRKVHSLEEKIIKGADIIFVVSKFLLERAKKINSNSYQILDGTTPEIFANFDGKIPDDMRSIRHPILGFSGTVFHRLDIDLIRELSLYLPDCSIVLVGNVLLRKRELEKINRDNIFLLGAKEYKQLPAYLMNFDACLVPYIISTFTSPPTKIYDYLATGKPIIATSSPELEGFGNLIGLAKTKEQFIASVRDSLCEDDPNLRSLRIKKAYENSWLKRTDELIGIIKTVRPGT